MTVNSEYLEFVEIADTGKTKVWAVNSRNHGDRLGQVHWFGRWRQYVFAPATGCVFNVGCMADIGAFIGEQMAERRKKREDAGHPEG